MSVPAAVVDVAAVDPALEGLAAALDVGAVAAGFEQEWGVAVTRCARLSARWEPGSRCVTTYAVELADRPPTIGAVEVTPAGIRFLRYDDDDVLPALHTCLEEVGYRIGTPLPRDGLEVEVVRWRPGERAVFRCRAGDVVTYGKVLATGAERLGRALTELHDAGLEDPQLPLVAAPLAVAPDLGLVVQGAVEGDPLAHRADAFEALGRALGAMHALPEPDAPRATLLGDVEATWGLLPVVERGDPAVAGRLADTLAVLRTMAEAGRGDGPWVASHGALRTDQVVMAIGRPALLDLDGFCSAHPARDVANLIAYLRWRGLRKPEQAARVAESRRAFLDGYRDGDNTLREADVDLYEAAALLKIAGRRYRALDVDEWPLVPRLLDTAETLLVSADHADARGAVPLDVLLDPGVMSGHLRRVLGPDAPAVSAVELLDEKPGHRALLRYRLGPAAEVLGKAYAQPATAERVCAVMQRLGTAVRVPDALGTVPALGLVLYAPLDGQTLDEVPGEAMTEGVRGAARWLAALHTSSLSLDRRLDVRHEADNAGVWAELVADRHPRTRRIARELAEALAATVPDDAAIAAPLHKDFHYQHVIAGEGLGVIDLDEARMGDPAFDVAHFTVYLGLLARRRGAPENAEGWRASFLHAYADATDRAPGAELAWFSAYTWVKIAKQLATGRGPAPRPAGDAVVGELDAALRSGLSWLR